jgi:flavodoxin I
MAQKLVVYDSVFGNTQNIAEAIGEALGDAPVINVSKVTKEDLDNLKILFIGSPTRAFRPTPATMTFIKGLESNALSGVKGAAFDTRIPLDQAESGFLKFMIKLFGYADVKIAKALAKAGADLALPSEGFAVSGTEGPLDEGELDRAQDWARGIL